jgi:anti-anti-sigma factor
MILIAVGRQPVKLAETSVGQEVTVSGRLDVTSVDEVRLALHDILDRGAGDLLVHLAQAEVHDAAGLGVIVGIHHRARRVGRRLVLVDVSPRLDRLLHASRLHRVLALGLDGDAAGMRRYPVAPMPHAETMVSEVDGVEPYSGTRAPVAGAVEPFTG